MDRLTRCAFCYCVTLFGMGMGAQMAYGQGAIYMVPADADPNDFGDGPTVIDARDLLGSSIALELFIRGAVIPVRGVFENFACFKSIPAAGTVAYVPGSAKCDTLRPDFVFFQQASRPSEERLVSSCPVDEFTCPDGLVRFAATRNSGATDISDGVPKYCGDFVTTISPDACGTFVFPLVGNSGAYTMDGMQIPVALQDLIIALDPLNDYLGLAPVVWDGEFEFDTVCASTDGPPGCAADADVWYEWTASCAGTLVVEAPGAQIGIYGPGLAGPPTDADETACDFAVSNMVTVRPGERYLIRIGTPSGAPLAETLTIHTEAAERYADFVGTDGGCTPDGVVDLNDIVIVLDMFRGDLATKCGKVDVDIAGPPTPAMDPRTACIPDGKTDLLDIIAVLDAFQGLDHCCATS